MFEDTNLLDGAHIIVSFNYIYFGNKILHIFSKKKKKKKKKTKTDQLLFQLYRKISDIRKFAVITLKVEQDGFSFQ